MKSMLSHPMILVVAVFATILCRTTMAISPPSIKTDSPRHELDYRDNLNICKSMVLDDITSLLSKYKSIASGVLPIYKRTVSDAYETTTFQVEGLFVSSTLANAWALAIDDVQPHLRSAVIELKDEVISGIVVDFEAELKMILDTAKTQCFEAVSLFFGVGKPAALTANKDLANTIIMNDLMEVKNELDGKLTRYLLQSFPERTLSLSMERVILSECYKILESRGPSKNYDWEFAVKRVKLVTNKFIEEFEGPIQSAKNEVQRLHVTSSFPTFRGPYFDVLPRPVSDM